MQPVKRRLLSNTVREKLLNPVSIMVWSPNVFESCIRPRFPQVPNPNSNLVEGPSYATVNPSVRADERERSGFSRGLRRISAAGAVSWDSDQVPGGRHRGRKLAGGAGMRDLSGYAARESPAAIGYAM
jgi:hypothetical protein